MDNDNKITRICFVPSWLTFSYRLKYGISGPDIFQGTFYELMKIVRNLPIDSSIVVDIFSPTSIYKVLKNDLLALEDKLISVNHIG
jgi:hypothetical protein